MTLFESNVDVDVDKENEEEETTTSVEEEEQTATISEEQTSKPTTDADEVPTEEAVKRSRDAPKEDAVEQAKKVSRDRPSFEGGKNVLNQHTPEQPADLTDSHPDLQRRGFLSPVLRRGISEAARDPDSPLHDVDIIEDAVKRLAADEERLETVVEKSEHARLLARARRNSRKLWAIPIQEMARVADSRMYTRERRAVRVAHEHAARAALEKVPSGEWIENAHVYVEGLDTLLDAQGWTVLLNH